MKSARRERLEQLRRLKEEKRGNIFTYLITEPIHEALVKTLKKLQSKYGDLLKVDEPLNFEDLEFTPQEWNEYDYCNFEAGLQDSHDVADSEILEIKRRWITEILQTYFNEYYLIPEDNFRRDYLPKAEQDKSVNEALKILSDETITEFRQKMFKRKYWKHIEQARYDYRGFFVGLFIDYLKNQRPLSQIAETVDFQKLFSAKALQELREAFTIHKEHFQKIRNRKLN